MKKEKSMKEMVAENGGYFACSFKAIDGRKSDNCLVRAHDAAEARSKIEKILGCMLAVFAVNAYVS